MNECLYFVQICSRTNVKKNKLKTKKKKKKKKKKKNKETSLVIDSQVDCVKQAYHSTQTASSITQISSLVKPLLVALMACDSDATDTLAASASDNSK